MESFNSLMWIVGISVFAMILLLGIMFSPQQSRKRRRKKLEARERPAAGKSKDWEAIARRRENYIQRLKDEIARLLREQKQKDDTLASFKSHSQQLQEKLKMEQQWREKEDRDTDKNAKRLQQLKDDLMKAEDSIGREHSANIRLTRESEELKRERDSLKKEKMDRSLEILKLKGSLEEARKELVALKKINEDLARKKEDSQWVAKSDFDKLQQQFLEMEKELARVSRNSSQ